MIGPCFTVWNSKYGLQSFALKRSKQSPIDWNGKSVTPALQIFSNFLLVRGHFFSRLAGWVALAAGGRLQTEVESLPIQRRPGQSLKQRGEDLQEESYL